MLSLDRANRLNEAALVAFCGERKYEETVVALATLAKVPIRIVDRLMDGDRPDPVLILCKAANLSWPAVNAVIMMRPDRDRDVRAGARCRLRQLRTALGVNRATRRPLLASAASQ